MPEFSAVKQVTNGGLMCQVSNTHLQAFFLLLLHTYLEKLRFTSLLQGQRRTGWGMILQVSPLSLSQLLVRRGTPFELLLACEVISFPAMPDGEQELGLL